MGLRANDPWTQDPGNSQHALVLDTTMTLRAPQDTLLEPFPLWLLASLALSPSPRGSELTFTPNCETTDFPGAWDPGGSGPRQPRFQTCSCICLQSLPWKLINWSPAFLCQDASIQPPSHRLLAPGHLHGQLYLWGPYFPNNRGVEQDLGKTRWAFACA